MSHKLPKPQPERQVHRNSIRKLQSEDSALSRAVSELSFVVKSHTFRNGVFTLRCTASILNLYTRSVERRLEEASMIDPEIVVFFGNTDDIPDRTPNSAATSGISLLAGIYLLTLLAINS